MEDSLFNDLVKSLEEVKENMEGKKKLKTTKVNSVEQTNCTSEKNEEEIDLDLYNQAMKEHNKNPQDISFDEMITALGFDK